MQHGSAAWTSTISERSTTERGDSPRASRRTSAPSGISAASRPRRRLFSGRYPRRASSRPAARPIASCPPGAYTCCLNQYGEPQLLAKDLQVDDLIDFAESLPAQILTEIENFWSLGEQFQRYGYLHRRGYLLYGPQGSGKSSVVHQVVHRIIKAGHVAVFCEHPGVLTRAMELFRKIEPDRPLVCMFEDIDAIIEIHGDSELLQWLDGSHQIDKVINIATTNYPERLDRRIVSRPRRFDRIIKIEAPAAQIREVYLAKKLPDLIARGTAPLGDHSPKGCRSPPWRSW